MTENEPRGWRRSRLVWGAGIAALLIGLYALFGFRIAPGIVRSQAIDYVRDTYGRELSIGEVRVQPFLLHLDVRDIAVPDADGTAMLALRRLFVDFEVASLWRRAFTFREVALEAPEIRAVVRPDGAMNLAELAPPEPADAPPAEDEGVPSVWIQRLDVTEGVVDFVDQARRRPFERRFTPVAFSLQDFRTTPEGGDFRLSARSQADEAFEWKGRFALAPAVSSEGEFKVSALRAPGVAEFLGDALPFDLTSGTIDLAGTYRLTLADTTDLKLQLPSVQLAALALRARGESADWVRIPSLAIADFAVALPEQTVRIARVTVTGLDADAWLSADGTMNVQRLFAPEAAPDPAPGAATQSAPAAGASIPPTPAPDVAERPWQVQLASLEVDDAKIHLEDRMQAPAKQFELAPVRLRLRDASLDLAKPLPLELSATFNGHARLTAAGTLTPEPLAMQLDVALDGARMSVLQPYVLPLADLTIRGGLASLKGRFEMRPPGTPPSEMSFAGDVVLTGFKSTDNALDEDFVNFGRVQVEKLRYDMAPDAVRIDRILVRDPYARAIISREQVLNVSAVLDPAGAAAAVQARRDRDAALARETPAERRERERREKAAAAAAEKKRKADARRGGATPTPVRQEVAPETMPIRIREVRVEGGRLNFSDFNVRPNFSADIRQLTGTVTGLSSSPTSRAKLALSGNVGEFSPVKIGGELQPFMFDRHTNVQMSFANISLPVFNPYSGTFAGYNIAKGKLDTEISYLIQDRKLDAKHHIRIDQLEWGEATPERGEATLPVQFATVLLRDKDGVIDLNLPVSGTLDDPKLRIGPIVWQVVKNLIVKAVTAPFALLGSLFAGSEEAQFVDFGPGRGELEPAAAGQLAALSKALVEKPGLQLEIPLGGAPELDGPALLERRYAAARATAMRKTLRRKPDDASPLPEFDTLERKQKLDVLTALVQKQTGAAPKIPDAPPPPEGTSRAEAKALREAAALEYLEQTARAATVVGEADYEALGQQRAEAVQRALVGDGQLEPSRLFVVKNGKVAAKDGKVRLELGLK
ncbi:MAG: DUF748 domain-containing protein [Steroidobacteraceae bacterium]|jgi:uncharacterized protein involved in outer membrane biogenesis|nr:DUF748 domain-containing protein [Steroidobacteraceae bacterium]